jgi:small multidrug resistance family-3 protein
VTVVRSIILFVLAAVAEIGGAWLVWQGVREHRGWIWIDAGVVALGLYGFVATLQPDANFGRILAAYGGVFVAGSLLWGVALDGFRPDRWDITGALICLGRRGRHHVRPAPGLRKVLVSEQNKSIIRRLVDEVMNAGRLDVLDEIYSPRMATAAKAWIAPFRTSFPDVHMRVVDLVAEGDKVAGSSVPEPSATHGRATRPVGSGSNESPRCTSSSCTRAGSPAPGAWRTTCHGCSSSATSISTLRPDQIWAGHVRRRGTGRGEASSGQDWDRITNTHRSGRVERHPVGAENSVTSSDLHILMNEAAEPVPS